MYKMEWEDNRVNPLIRMYWFFIWLLGGYSKEAEE